jgi:hypothetical protein
MTGVYYFEKFLDAEEQLYFKQNLISGSTEEYLWQFLDKSFESFSDFLNKAFIWINTPQGHYYWALVEKRSNFYNEISVALKSVFENEFYDFSDERIQAMLEYGNEYIQENVKPYQTI